MIHRAGRLRVVLPFATAPVAAAGGLILRAMMSQTIGASPAGWRRFLALLLITQCFVTGLLWPYLLAMRAHPRLTLPVLRRALGALVGCQAALAAGVCAACIGLGAPALLAAATAQLLLAAFAALLLGVFFLLSSLGASAPLCQLAASLASILLLGTLFCTNGIIEGCQGAGLRDWLVQAAVTVNPVSTLAKSVCGLDMLRGRIMYDLSVIPSYYRFSYTSWQKMALGYLLVGAALALVGALLRHLWSSVKGETSCEA